MPETEAATFLKKDSVTGAEKFWEKNFRMGKDVFHELVTMLDPYIGPKTTPNYRKLSTPKKLAMVLYYLKDARSLWMTVNAFGVH